MWLAQLWERILWILYIVATPAHTMDLQIFSRRQSKENFWYQKGDKIIPATMGLVPSDLTGLGHHNAGLVKVQFCLGSGAGEAGVWQAKEDCEVWVRHPISYTTSWVQNFILKQRARIAKHRTKRPKKKKKCVFHSCLICFSKLLKDSKKLYCT